MITFQESQLLSADKQTLLYIRTALPDSEPHGVVQIIHGISEHIGRYDEFMTFLANHNFIAVGHDHIGHGHSLSSSSIKAWFSEECGWILATADVQDVPNASLLCHWAQHGQFSVA